MGQPNFKRLAELGQLPDYAKSEMPALATISETVASQTEEIVKEQENIQDLILDENNDLPEGFVELDGGKVELDEDGHGEFVDDLLK